VAAHVREPLRRTLTLRTIVSNTVAAVTLGLGSFLPMGLSAQGAGAAADPLAALAGALLRLEYAIAERPIGPADLARVNIAFDAATLAFFGGRTDEVLSRLDVLTAEVEPDAEVRARQAGEAQRVLMGLPAAGQTLAAPRPPVPFRIAGPTGVVDAPLPVVVALHGAGGNEHMFVEAYGAGRLVQLAQSMGFVVISPQTNLFAAGGAPAMRAALDGMLEAAGALYPVDRSRVVVMGHSMGAGVAWQLAMATRDAADGSLAPIGAVACLAGPCGPPGMASGAASDAGDAGYPPLLLIAGELDPLAAPPRMLQAAENATARGVAVTYRELPDQGHTLLVGAILEDVIEWLMGALEPI
jgi:predicted esterase